MHGANRPPWIDKEEFYKMPFNFCDRWCERCELDSICRVRQKELQRKEMHLKKGEAPNSLKSVFEDIHESFAETGKLLAKELKRLGITQADISRQVQEKEPNPTRFKTYKTAHRLMLRVHKLLNKIPWLIDTPDKRLGDNLEILHYYNNLLVPKIYRAVSSREEEKSMPDDYNPTDAKTSAFIACNALTEMADALQDLFSNKQLKSSKREIGQLTLLVESLNDIIQSEFAIEPIPNFH